MAQGHVSPLDMAKMRSNFKGDSIKARFGRLNFTIFLRIDQLKAYLWNSNWNVVFNVLNAVCM